MAVARRRPGFTLWLAWVGAGALGAALAAAASQPGNEVFGDPGASYWVPIVLAAPLALLQFLVLRGLIGVSVVAAGVWAGLTLVAYAASGFAISGWYFVIPQLVTRAFIPVETAMDLMFTGGDYIKPLLLGLAQGLVLAWVFGRPLMAAWWVGINLVAFRRACGFLLGRHRPRPGRDPADANAGQSASASCSLASSAQALIPFRRSERAKSSVKPWTV